MRTSLTSCAILALVLESPEARAQNFGFFDSVNSTDNQVERRIADDEGSQSVVLLPPPPPPGVTAEPIQVAQAQVAAREAQRRRAQQLIGVAEEQLERLKKLKDNLENERDEAEKRRARRQSDLQNLMADAEKFANDPAARQAFNDNVANLNRLIQEDGDLIDDLERRIAEAEQLIGEGQEKIDAGERALGDLDRQLAEAREALNRAEADLAAAQAKAAEEAQRQAAAAEAERRQREAAELAAERKRQEEERRQALFALPLGTNAETVTTHQVDVVVTGTFFERQFGAEAVTAEQIQRALGATIRADSGLTAHNDPAAAAFEKVNNDHLSIDALDGFDGVAFGVVLGTAGPASVPFFDVGPSLLPFLDENGVVRKFTDPGLSYFDALRSFSGLSNFSLSTKGVLLVYDAGDSIKNELGPDKEVFESIHVNNTVVVHAVTIFDRASGTHSTAITTLPTGNTLTAGAGLNRGALETSQRETATVITGRVSVR